MKYILTTVLVVTILTGCSSKDTKKDQWRKRIKAAYQELCHKSIEPSVTNMTHSDDGVWVYFTFKDATMQTKSSSMRFTKMGEEWVSTSGSARSAICR